MKKNRKQKNSSQPQQPAQPNGKKPGSSTNQLALYIRLGLMAVAIVLVTALMLNQLGGPIDSKQSNQSEQGVGTDATIPVHANPTVIVPAAIRLTLQNPKDGTMYPPEIARPTFQWVDTDLSSKSWMIDIKFADGTKPMQFTTDGTITEMTTPTNSDRYLRQWAPSDDDWETIKQHSVFSGDDTSKLSDDQGALITIRRSVASVDTEPSQNELTTRIYTSKDEVGAPIFYREVNLPFSEAVKDPAAHIRWRFGSVASKEQPPIVMDKLPVCGNCHSFSADGSLLGMDIDYADDKGSYVICPVSEKMVFDSNKIISWSEYQREDEKRTFGLLSRISPDGRYVLSMVKDRSVFLAIDNNPMYSQLFFPIQGILVYYDRENDSYHPLPGADDPDLVQSNPVWSPDGKHVVFARNEAYKTEADETDEGGLGLSKLEDVKIFLTGEKTFKFDLYRIPFNDGKGGVAQPITGASEDNMSNYFAKYSPDGRWIVFCKSRSFMLLQPDSQLYIIPAEGGEPRRLECNSNQMNSWHSWSPNSRWLVFSSKANSMYTQLFLTHIDEQGHSTTPVVLSNFTVSDMAANIPEFVNTTPDKIRKITEGFVDDLTYIKTGKWNFKEGDYDLAIKQFNRALEINPNNPLTYEAIGTAYELKRDFTTAETMYRKAMELNPGKGNFYRKLATVLGRQKKYPEAIRMLEKHLELNSEDGSAHKNLGIMLLDTNQKEKGIEHIRQAIEYTPDDPFLYSVLGTILVQEEKFSEAIPLLNQSLERDPTSTHAISALIEARLALATDPQATLDVRHENFDMAERLANYSCELTEHKDPISLLGLAEVLSATGKQTEAIHAVQSALQLAHQIGNPELINSIQQQLQMLQKQQR